MAYLDPRMVLSPKGKVSDLNVIVDGKAGQYSIALMKWENKDAVGVRWNGHDNSIGNPQSRGVATWFVLPSEVAIPFLKEKLKDQQISTMVQDSIEEYLASNNYATLE